MKRVILHWSAGGPSASDVDKEHYHFMVQQNGKIVEGDHTPEDNLVTSDGNYAKHTLHCNTGSIGVALCGMMGAIERPFSAGRFPITTPQIEVMCGLVARLCRKYNIEITRENVLSHAEVQPTLGIKQNGKWDIAWIPGLPKPSDPVVIGDHLRELIMEKIG